MNTGKFSQQLKYTIYGVGSELLDANVRTKHLQKIEMRACSGHHQDARILFDRCVCTCFDQPDQFSISGLLASPVDRYDYKSFYLCRMQL